MIFREEFQLPVKIHVLYLLELFEIFILVFFASIHVSAVCM